MSQTRPAGSDSDTTVPAVPGLRSAAQKGKGMRARLRRRPHGWSVVGRMRLWPIGPTRLGATVAGWHPIPLCRAERSVVGWAACRPPLCLPTYVAWWAAKLTTLRNHHSRSARHNRPALCRANRRRWRAEKGASLFEPAGRVCEAPRPTTPQGGNPEGARKRAVLLCLAFLHKQESRSPAGARPGQRSSQFTASGTIRQTNRRNAPTHPYG